MIECLRPAFLSPFFDVGYLGIVLDGVVGLTEGSGEDFGVWLEGGELAEETCAGGFSFWFLVWFG
jgi:hypothetical protein